ncbi:hypothetical protein J6590_049545 [Homalodisca vitripennis]|nr:hypothetical protein J6590_049545 [Homalodisca vitripennis]
MIDKIQANVDETDESKSVSNSMLLTGGGDPGDDRQDTGQCGGGEEETQCHPLCAADR